LAGRSQQLQGRFADRRIGRVNQYQYLSHNVSSLRR
jgi:hypothetical protein